LAVIFSLIVFTTGSLLSQANGNLFWWFQGIENVESVASVEDMDGDGWPEAIVMSYDAGAPSGDDLFLIKGNSSGYGEVIWSTKPYGGLSGGGGYGDQCLSTMSDISGDGLSDILLGTAWGGRTAFSIAGVNGNILFQYDTYENPPSGWCYAVNPIEDLNEDGLDEVLAAFGNETRAAFCYDGASVGEATVIWKWNANGDGVLSICSLGDVNGDGYADALAGCGGNFVDNRVVVIDGSSTGDPASTLWTYETGSGLQDVSAILDVNDSGADDALAGGWDGYVYCIEGGSSGTGSVIWQVYIGDVVMRLEPISDVNSDGIDDVLVGSWDNKILCLNGATGGLLWATPTGSLNGGDVWTIYPIPDVDGDGMEDVIAGSFDTKIYCVNGVSGDVIWTYTTGNRVYTVRSIGDINGDGVAEVVGGTQMLSSSGGKVYCIEGDSQGSWINVSAEPDTAFVFPGENFGVTVSLENSTPYRQTTDAWIDIRTPGEKTKPLMREYGISLPGGITVSPHLEWTVPSAAPAGSYRFVMMIGEYGSTVVDADSFNFKIANSSLIMNEDTWSNRGYEADTWNIESEDWNSRFEDPAVVSGIAGYESSPAERREMTIESDRECLDSYLQQAIDTFGPNTDRILKARRMGRSIL
jgi:outer membrane protein assembly factor BamB